jgi:hypothetical protein
MKLLHNPAIRLWLASNVWMFRRRLQPIYVSLLFLALFSDACAGRHAPAALSAPAPQQAQPPALGEKIHISGISDAGKINDFLYRGSQPNQKGIARPPETLRNALPAQACANRPLILSRLFALLR